MAEARNLSIKSGITALAGGANSASTPILDGDINVIATCATGSDSVRLPANQPPGTVVWVRNNGAAAAAVFPPSGGAINGGSVDAAVNVTNAKASCYIQVGSGSSYGLTWVTLAGA